MSSGKTRKRIQQFAESLEVPFRHKKPKGPGPGSSSASTLISSNNPANSLDTTLTSNVSSGPSNRGISSSPLTGHTSAGNQYPQPPSPAVSVPSTNEAFRKAVQGYIVGLSDDDKSAFYSATSVIQKLEELPLGKSRISSSHTTLIQKAQKVLQCVKQFLAPIAICIQHHPEVSSLIVGGLNCVLTLALGYIEFFESLTDMMERIGDHLTYLSKYATGSIAFQNSDQVQKALVAAYCDLLDFYVKVRKLFTQREGKLSYAQGFKRFLRVTWEPFEAHFLCIETKFIHHANIVVRLASAEHQIHFYDEKLGERRRKALKWLSPDDLEGTHESHFGKRFQNTGQWLLDDLRFISWRDQTQSGLLWCYGAPGSGKTILASLVIDHLSARHELSSNIGITFIYCSYTLSRSPLEYIRLAIKQLCRRVKPLPRQLDELYQAHYESHSQPSLQELQGVFLAIVQQFNCVFLVLDALDECTLDQRAQLCQFFAGIVDLSDMGHGLVKLFVASRKELDIERAFIRKSFPTMEVEAKKVDCDIELYVKAQIEQRLQDGSLTLNNVLLKDKIFTALTTNAGGMFLWVEFQLKAVCAEVSDDGIEETLQNIPKDIEGTYERIMDIIEKKPPAQRELAKKALLFVAYAREPLSIDVLALAIATKDPAQSLDRLRSSISTEKIILHACGNLLTINMNSNIRCVSFVHFSVHEYLTTSRPKLLHTLFSVAEMAHREIARMCMVFLLILYSHIQDYSTNVESSFANNYILPSLPFHLLAGNLYSLPSNDELINLSLLFFEKGPPLLTSCDGNPPLHRNFLTFSPSVLALMFNLPVSYQSYDPQALYGKQLYHWVLTWVHETANGRYLPFVQVSDDRLAMHYATDQLDSVAACQRLYAYGYPIEYSYCRSEIPLRMVRSQTLCPVGVPALCTLTPLYLVKSGEVARFLLSRGASVNRSGFPNLLGHVAQRGNTQVIQLLLDYGAEQKEEDQGRALEILASDGKVEAIRFLFNNGVDVNTRSGSALQAAAGNGKVEAMRFLLDNGADVHTLGGQYGSALQAAICNDKPEAIRLLLYRGADPYVQSGLFGNALEAAAGNGKVKAMQALLDQGVDVNVGGGRFGNALQAAASRGHVEAIGLLLDHRVDANVCGGEFGNALQAAATMGHMEALRLLLDRGADVNAQDPTYGTALQAEAYRGNIEAMQLLLDKGAEVNVQGGEYGNALQAAARQGNVGAMQLLLDKGADIHAKGKYGSALQAAACQGNIAAVQLLLDEGADVHWKGGKYGSALQAAASHGKVEVLRLLRDMGAIDRSIKVDEILLRGNTPEGKWINVGLLEVETHPDP